MLQNLASAASYHLPCSLHRPIPSLKNIQYGKITKVAKDLTKWEGVNKSIGKIVGVRHHESDIIVVTNNFLYLDLTYPSVSTLKYINKILPIFLHGARIYRTHAKTFLHDEVTDTTHRIRDYCRITRGSRQITCDKPEVIIINLDEDF